MNRGRALGCKFSCMCVVQRSPFIREAAVVAEAEAEVSAATVLVGEPPGESTTRYDRALLLGCSVPAGVFPTRGVMDGVSFPLPYASLSLIATIPALPSHPFTLTP